MNHWRSRRNRDCLDYSGYGSYPPILTPEEEAYYVNKFIEGRDIEARNILIERNLRLVPYIAKRFNNVDKDDLNSVGQIGLVKAVSSYDPGKGSRLATYATRCIENAIQSQRTLRRGNIRHLQTVGACLARWAVL